MFSLLLKDLNFFIIIGYLYFRHRLKHVRYVNKLNDFDYKVRDLPTKKTIYFRRLSVHRFSVIILTFSGPCDRMMRT